MRNQKLETITLSRRPFREKDILVTALAKHSGRLTLLARGAQKPGGALAGVSEPFVYARVMIARPKDISVLVSADIRESFTGLKADLPAIGAAYHIAALADRASLQWEDSERLFLNLLSCLYLLESGGDPDIVRRFFELRLCSWAGYSLNLTHCPCGRPLGQAVYSLDAGYFVCEECAKGDALTAFPQALFSYLLALEECQESGVRRLSFPPKALADLKRLMETHLLIHMQIKAEDPGLAEVFAKQDR